MKKFVKCVNRLIFYITFFTIVVMIFNFLVTDSNVRCKESSINFIKNCKVNGVGFYEEGGTINDILKMADENMYTHKKFLKNKGVNVLHQ